MFKWAASEELIPVSIYDALRTVAGLRAGRTDAREPEPVGPVADETVDATLPFVAPPVAAMIQLQRATGMRPGEVVIMRASDIDASGEVWMYRPRMHKGAWRGQSKTIPLGPRAQQIVARFLKPATDAYLFSPREAEEWHWTRRSAKIDPDRKTPVYPSELRRRERDKQARRKRIPKRPKREQYSTASYRRAITYGIQRAKRNGIEIPRWHPHQLRHTRATEIRKQFGLEAASARTCPCRRHTNLCRAGLGNGDKNYAPNRMTEHLL